MLTKPNFTDQEIITCLKNVYQLEVKQISFLPLGADFNTAVYLVKTLDHASYFLKLRFGPFLDATITVPKYLSDLGIKHIIAPIATCAGELWTHAKSYTAILYPYVNGHNGIDTTISNQQWIEFGQTMKKIHSVVLPQKIACTIPHETFSFKWHKSVKTFLARIEHESFQEPVAAQTALFLKTKKHIIEKLLERTQELALLLQKNPPEFVLCHADLHKWNVLIDKDDTLYIVDWDTIIFAPKERDLMFIGAGIEGEKSSSALEENLFYQGYGQTNINNTAIAYYRFERIIQDIGEYCEHIFLTKADKKDKIQSLNHLQSNFMPGGTIERALLSDKKMKSELLSKKTVEVVPYNQNWPLIFAIESNKIKAALGNNFVEIHHVGSTSVPGLDAKPTIDIICCVKDLNFNHKPLIDLQYEYKGGFNLPFRKTFTYRSPHLKVNLHIFEKDDPEVELNLLFCDYLRAHPEARDQYAALKYKLLEDERSHKKNGPIYKGYTLGKHNFIQNILKKAGFNRLRFVFCTYDTEWQTIKKMRNQYFFEQCKTEDPYTWTFDSQNHKHFVLYKGINIIGYAHIQLFWENKEAAIRLILTENNVYTKNIITLIEKWLKLEGYHLLKQEAQNMLKIDLLKNHPSAIPTLAHIWHEVLGKIWMPEIGIDEIKALYYEELNQDIPLTYIALYNDIPVGSCTLELQGGIQPDLGPWIGDLVVDPKYQKQGIGKKLLNTTVVKAKELGFKQLYLFTFDHAIAEYYQHLGWSKIGMDTFKGHPVIIMKVEL